jgi:hypothetical protein
MKRRHVHQPLTIIPPETIIACANWARSLYQDTHATIARIPLEINEDWGYIHGARNCSVGASWRGSKWKTHEVTRGYPILTRRILPENTLQVFWLGGAVSLRRIDKKAKDP